MQTEGNVVKSIVAKQSKSGVGEDNMGFMSFKEKYYKKKLEEYDLEETLFSISIYSLDCPDNLFINII